MKNLNQNEVFKHLENVRQIILKKENINENIKKYVKENNIENYKLSYDVENNVLNFDDEIAKIILKGKK